MTPNEMFNLFNKAKTTLQIYLEKLQEFLFQARKLSDQSTSFKVKEEVAKKSYSATLSPTDGTFFLNYLVRIF